MWPLSWKVERIGLIVKKPYPWRQSFSVRCLILVAVPFSAGVTSSCKQMEPIVSAVRACVSCHDDDRPEDALLNHTATDFPSSCEDCHTQAHWTPAASDHRFFPLSGGHSIVSCSDCHGNEPVPTTCIGCHEADRDRPTDPNHRAQGFPSDCSNCHTILGWKPAAHDHSSFPLVGAHSAIACASCHETDPVPTTCLGCHESDRERASVPNHLAPTFPTTCEDCHDARSGGWNDPVFDHDQFFRLVGKHSTADCTGCHERNPIPTACFGCHAEDRQSAPNNETTPNHLAADFPAACDTCHSATGWQPAATDHSKFPLNGAHSGLACTGCHPNPQQPNIPTATNCLGCHDADRSRSALVDHLVPDYPTDCERCHTTNAWQPAAFDHASFPLEGGHGTVGCAVCHNQEPVPNTCFGCHAADRNRPTNPNHVAAGFSTECDTCHNAVAWIPAAIDHASYPLVGAHSSVTCNACHAQDPAPITCFGCHADDRSTPTNPNHLAAGFPTTCENCHDPQDGAFRATLFDHGQFYPLTGTHITTAPCASCHNLSPVPTTCVGCHNADRNRPTNPNHLAAGFSTACDSCHSTNAWRPAALDHSAFPLTGAHTSVVCESCHDQDPVPTTCSGCHQGDTPTGTFPNHAQAGFPNACEDCHSNISWKPATFNHTQPPFWPLVAGPHKNKACNNCHYDPGDVTQFSCFIGCHKHTVGKETSEHSGVRNFSAESQACISCHPSGKK